MRFCNEHRKADCQKSCPSSAAGGLIVLVNICISDLFSMRFVLISVSYLVRAEYLH